MNLLSPMNLMALAIASSRSNDLPDASRNTVMVNALTAGMVGKYGVVLAGMHAADAVKNEVAATRARAEATRANEDALSARRDAEEANAVYTKLAALLKNENAPPIAKAIKAAVQDLLPKSHPGIDWSRVTGAHVMGLLAASDQDGTKTAYEALPRKAL